MLLNSYFTKLITHSADAPVNILHTQAILDGRMLTFVIQHKKEFNLPVNDK